MHWQHFYGANVSFKKSLIESDRFNTNFSYGVGFDNSEMGYRLACKGMKMRYEPKCEVVHNHQQTLGEVCEMFSVIYENSQLFEKLHPEVHVIPGKSALFWLRVFLPIAKMLSSFIPEAYWWYEWKKVWIPQIEKSKNTPIFNFLMRFGEGGTRFTNL